MLLGVDNRQVLFLRLVSFRLKLGFIIYCKIFKVCLTILGHYALKGLRGGSAWSYHHPRGLTTTIEVLPLL